MTPFIIISLLSISLVGLMFESPPDDDLDADKVDGLDSDNMDDELLDPVSDPDNSAVNVEGATGSPNLPDDDSLDRSGATDDVFIALRNEMDVSGNTMSGGAGDDFIRTSRLPDYDGATSLNWFAAHLGAGGNLVFGGEGDDTIEMSEGDTAFGGAGDDTFVVVTDPVAVDPEENGAEIEDFELGNDIVFVQLPPNISNNVDSEMRSNLHSQIQLDFADGNTNVIFDGNPILKLEGIHEISIGVQEDADRDVPISDIHNMSDVRSLDLVGLDGLPISGDPPDIIVSRYVRL